MCGFAAGSILNRGPNRESRICTKQLHRPVGSFRERSTLCKRLFADPAKNVPALLGKFWAESLFLHTKWREYHDYYQCIRHDSAI